jgi:hypothetical protein
MSKYQDQYGVFHAPPHPGIEPQPENYSSTGEYNQAHNAWQNLANRYNTYLAEQETWDALYAEYLIKAESWQSGFHPLLLETEFNDIDSDPSQYATYDGFLIIKYLTAQIDEE